MNNTPPVDNNKQIEPQAKPVPVAATGTLGKNATTPLAHPLKPKSEVPDTVIASDGGINLIPILSKEEVQTEEKKKKINMSAIVSLIILFVISILIVGLNIVFKFQLNAEKEKLIKSEAQVEGLSQKIIGNNEILDRIYLYNDIEKGRYSAKAVLEYINGITSKTNCTLTAFAFTGLNGIEFTGKAQSLEDVAKLWYLLGNDSRIEKISLRAVGKSSQDVTFSFYGSFVLDNFLKVDSK